MSTQFLLRPSDHRNESRWSNLPQFTTRFLSCAETTMFGTSFTFQISLHSFLLENVWSTLPTLGNYALLLEIYKA